MGQRHFLSPSLPWVVAAELLEASLRVLVKLGVFLVALLEKHAALLPVRESLLPGKIVLVDGRLNGFVGVLCNGIL